MKKLLLNTGLAFLAGFATTLGAFLAATPKAPDRAAVIAAAGAAIYAGVRFAVGALAKNIEAVPTIPVDA
jgi:hypothetical protein